MTGYYISLDCVQQKYIRQYGERCQHLQQICKKLPKILKFITVTVFRNVVLFQTKAVPLYQNVLVVVLIQTAIISMSRIHVVGMVLVLCYFLTY